MLAAAPLPAAMPQEWLDTLAGAALAFARVAPTALLVPAFGLGVAPAAVRLAFGVALLFGVVPAVQSAPADGTLPLRLLEEALRGLPVALTAASALWVATMAGGLADEVVFGRVASDGAETPPLGRLFSLFAAAAFFAAGVPSRLATLLLAAPPVSPWERAFSDIAAGIGVAVGVAGPLLVVSIVVQVASGLAVRAAPSIDGVLERARPLLLLLALGLVFERIAAVIASIAGGAAQ